MTWRKELTREITKTVIKSVTTHVLGGTPTISENEDIEVVGNVPEARAIKLAVKKFGTGTTVVSVEADTQKYKMPIEDFMKHATLVEDESAE